MDELWRWPATELARAIRTHRVSSREAVQACLDRTRAVNPELNAIVDTMDEEALAAADAADRAVARGEAPGALHGVPGLSAPLGELDGVPLGVQLVASRYREDRLFDAAEVLESRYPSSTPIDPAWHR